MLVGDRLQPARLVERAARTPHRGDMHRLRDALRLDVVDELLDRVVAADAEIVAEHARDRRIGQPCHILAQPDVMMRVDHRSVVGHVSLSHCFILRTDFNDCVGECLEFVG